MNFKILVAMMVLSSSVSVYSSDSKHMNMDMSKSKPMEKSKSSRKALDKETKAQLLNVLEVNEDLHASFFKYDGKKIEENAERLKKAIDGVKNDEITKLLAFSKGKLSGIEASKDKKENRQTYHLVSSALVHVLNKYDVGEKYNAYSCPMVKKKWVQNSKKTSKVHNPYMAGMPHCGSQDTHF